MRLILMSLSLLVVNLYGASSSSSSSGDGSGLSAEKETLLSEYWEFAKRDTPESFQTHLLTEEEVDAALEEDKEMAFHLVDLQGPLLEVSSPDEDAQRFAKFSMQLALSTLELAFSAHGFTQELSRYEAAKMLGKALWDPYTSEDLSDYLPPIAEYQRNLKRFLDFKQKQRKLDIIFEASAANAFLKGLVQEKLEQKREELLINLSSTQQLIDATKLLLAEAGSADPKLRKKMARLERLSKRADSSSSDTSSSDDE